MSIRGLISWLGLAFLTQASLAITLIPTADGVLAKTCPEVVVARWLGPGPQPARLNSDLTKRLVSIEVLDVIKGKMKMGRRTVCARVYLGEHDPAERVLYSGSPVLSYVTDPTKPTIWFLEYPKDAKGPMKGVASVTDIGGIQPLAWRPLVQVLVRPDRERIIGGFLRAHDGVLAERALRFIAGDYSDDLSYSEESGYPWTPPTVLAGEEHWGVPLPQLWPAVRDKLSTSNGKLRAETAHCLASLIGPKAIPYVRPLLADPSPDVRMRAVELLAYLQDADSYPAFAKALPTFSGQLDSDRYRECLITLLQLTRIGGPAVFDATAKFLELDGSATLITGVNGLDEPVPILAHRSLDMTGSFEFPFDTDACTRGFAEVRKLPTSEWPAALQRVLGDCSVKWDATVARGGGFLTIVLTNESRHPVRLLRGPIRLKITMGVETSGELMGNPKDSTTFLTLGVGSSTSMSVKLTDCDPHPGDSISLEVDRGDPHNRRLSWVGSIPCRWVNAKGTAHPG